MVEIYGTEVCGFCLRAKRLAEQYQMKYVWKDVHEKEVSEELRSRIGEYKTIPQIFWNDRHVGGYSEFALEIENTTGGYGEGQF